MQAFNETFLYHMSVVVEETLRKTKPISIYLTGSFGRDEGSLLRLNGKLSPLRDYDILIVVDKYIDEQSIKKIREQIHERLGLPDPYSREFKFGGFTVWFTQVILKNINDLPLLKIFELKHSSKLIWGKDIRNQICIDFNALSKYNGVLILFSKVEGLLGLLNFEGLTKRDPEKTVDLYYECMKAYTEIASCLNLLSKEYKPSFLDRSLKLKEDFKLKYPELNKKNSKLPSSIVNAAYSRLLIDSSLLETLDFGNLLTGTVADLKLALWYYLQNAYSINIPWSQSYAMFDCYLKELDTKLLSDLFDFYLHHKFRLHSKFARDLVIKIYKRYCLAKFVIIARRRGTAIKLRIIFSKYSNIMLRLWLCGFLLLESLTSSLTIDEKLLNHAEDRLSELVNLKSVKHMDISSRFSEDQRILVALLDLSDKIFHRKN